MQVCRNDHKQMLRLCFCVVLQWDSLKLSSQGISSNQHVCYTGEDDECAYYLHVYRQSLQRILYVTAADKTLYPLHRKTAGECGLPTEFW